MVSLHTAVSTFRGCHLCQGSLCLLCCGSSIWWAILAAEPSAIAWTASPTGLTQEADGGSDGNVPIDLYGMWICNIFYEICWISWVRHFRVNAETQADSTWVCVAQLHCFPIQRIRVFRHLMNLMPRFSAQPVLKLMLLLIAVAHVVKLALLMSFLRPLKKHTENQRLQ